MVHGGWNSLRVGIIAVGISLSIGGVLGLLAGFYESMPLGIGGRILLFAAIGLLFGAFAGWIAGQIWQPILLTGLATRWVNFRQSSYGVTERVLVIGSGNGGEFATWMLRRPDFRPFYSVVGYVDDDPRKQGMRYDGVKVLGTTADIADLVKKHQVGMLFFAIGKIQPQDKERILAACRRTNLPVVIIPEVIENIRKMFVESVNTVNQNL